MGKPIRIRLELTRTEAEQLVMYIEQTRDYLPDLPELFLILNSIRDRITNKLEANQE